MKIRAKRPSAQTPWALCRGISGWRILVDLMDDPRMSNQPLSGLSVLILEDDPGVLRHCRSQLDRLGLDTTAVSTMADARAALGDQTFDFLLLDVNLPDGTGLDLLREGKAAASSGVVVMNAQGGDSGDVDAKRLGASDYWHKHGEPGVMCIV